MYISFKWRVRGLGLYETFNNISHISFTGEGNWRKPPICYKSLTNFITQCCIEYTLPLV